ncbi:hypothetical protein CGCFRS4_v006501 [Colletotrichum fructicola]|nr:hypothetical protein CGCFRS4_v006501 [Colletotrichum fructicola]
MKDSLSPEYSFFFFTDVALYHQHTLALHSDKVPSPLTRSMHSPTAIILLALVGLGLAGNPQYKLSCDPAVPAAYQASFQAYAKRNCGTGEYGGKPGTWHDNTQTCEAPTPLEGNISGRYYHPIFASSLGGANISPRCNWLSA